MTNHKQNSDIFKKTNILPSNTRNKKKNIQCYNLLVIKILSAMLSCVFNFTNDSKIEARETRAY